MEKSNATVRELVMFTVFQAGHDSVSAARSYIVRAFAKRRSFNPFVPSEQAAKTPLRRPSETMYTISRYEQYFKRSFFIFLLLYISLEFAKIVNYNLRRSDLCLLKNKEINNNDVLTLKLPN